MADVATPLRTIREVDPRTIGSPTHSGRGRPLQAVKLSIPQSPVTQNGSFEYDRIIKQGEVLKRTRKTKSWKTVFLVLRPNVLSIYSDKDETKLRHRIVLANLTAVARQTDPKRKEKHIFALFSPSRNYHLEASSDQVAHEWVEEIRREARMDEDEEEMMLASPGGAHTSPYQGFERSIDAQIGPGAEERALHAGYASSSDADAGLSPPVAIPRTRTRDSANLVPRQASYAEYSGAERTSMSDFSDFAGPAGAARLSALSLAQTIDPRPSTSSAQPQYQQQFTQSPLTPSSHPIYGSSAPASAGSRPGMGNRNFSQLSTTGLSPSDIHRAQNPYEEEGVLHNTFIYLLKSKSGVRQWKKVWLVIRPKGLTLYKNEDEYAALMVLGLSSIIDVVGINPVSRSKEFCLQVITEERNYKFCALDEEGLNKCLGVLKGLIQGKKARAREKERERKASFTG